jgi:D-galactose 1-dehydrogenase
MKIRLGIIGLGHVADAQIKALKRVDNIKLTTAFDIDAKKSSMLPQGVTFFNSIDEMLDSKEMDVVLVSTPNETHYDIADLVLSANYDLILEKPATHSRSDFLKLKVESEHRKLFFCIALHASQAYEVKWWQDHQKDFIGDSVNITGFSCGFYDPYIANGEMLPKAKGLGGSWFDSAINALSVIGLFIPPSKLRVIDARMTKVPIIDCLQLQGHGLFSFETITERIGRGIIDTNWTLGLNSKITCLFYDDDRIEVTLNHSMESISVLEQGNLIFKKNFSDGNSRLENHYYGVFNDLLLRYKNRRSNIEYAFDIHDLLFSADFLSDNYNRNY